MRIIVTSILALFAIETCSASAPVQALEARQSSNPVDTFNLEGEYYGQNNYYGQNYTISLQEDSNQLLPINNSMVVYSIEPSPTSKGACFFVGADGSVTYVSGYQIDTLPAVMVSAACFTCRQCESN